MAKQRAKQAVRRVIGEPYVGKRLKLRHLGRMLSQLELSPRQILDAGAEDATFTYWLADRYPLASVYATDVDNDAMAACSASKPARYARVSFQPGTFEDLPAERFDLVALFDVLEHIEDDAAAAKAIHRAMAPGATLLVNVPRDVWTHWDGRQERVPDVEARKINAGAFGILA